MKKLLVTALLLLFTLSTAGLKSETAYKMPLATKQASSTSTKSNLNLLPKKCNCEKKHKKEELECHCKSKCSLSCLKSECCSLNFTVLTSQSGVIPIGSPVSNAIPYGEGFFFVTINAPNGEVVATMPIIRTDISNNGTTPFTALVPAPICAGVYTVSIQNNTGDDFFQPFVQLTVTNSCNSKSVFVNFAQFEGEDILSFPDGTSLSQAVNILPTFVDFEKCETECECKKKCDCDK
jgi:hypothetical protein